MPQKTLLIHQGRETKGGCFPFRGVPRARSESSFSEIKYENNVLPTAGLTSARTHHHFGKDCHNVIGMSQRAASHPLLLCMDEAIQPSSSATQGLDGRRLDPANVTLSAGAPSHVTSNVATNMDVPENKDSAGKSVGPSTKKSQLTILTVPHKKLFDPPRRDVVRHKGDTSDPWRYARRQGYDDHRSCRQSFTWMECAESGFSPKVCPNREKHQSVHVSCKGEKRYNVCGTQDLKPAATHMFTKADCPPSARAIKENDRRQLQRFERNTELEMNNLLASSDNMRRALDWTACRYTPRFQNGFYSARSFRTGSAGPTSMVSESAPGLIRSNSASQIEFAEMQTPGTKKTARTGTLPRSMSASQADFLQPQSARGKRFESGSRSSRASTAPGESRASSVSRNSNESRSRTNPVASRRAMSASGERTPWRN